MELNHGGKVVLVAGGTGGLGKAVTLAFLAEGAKTIVTYRSQPEYDALRQAAGSAAELLEGHTADVTNETAVKALVSDIVNRHGRLDVLVNTVGGYAGGIRLWELDTKTFDQLLALNLRSGYGLARAALLPMLKQMRGGFLDHWVNPASRPSRG